VLKHLKKASQLGSLAEPSVFVKGTIPMTWQRLDFYRGKSDQRLVLFSGYDPERKFLVGLVGPAAHVTGMNDEVPAEPGYANPAFWSRFAEEIIAPSEQELEENMYDMDNQIDWEARRRSDGPPKIMLEFVAKTFTSKNGFTIGSPLYVAEPTNVVE